MINLIEKPISDDPILYTMGYHYMSCELNNICNESYVSLEKGQPVSINIKIVIKTLIDKNNTKNIF